MRKRSTGSAKTTATSATLARVDTTMSTESAQCWICMGDACTEEVVRPCRCPREAHPKCLARWQLYRAGKAEESTCRFCGDKLPDWRPALTPGEVDSSLSGAVMAVKLNGMEHRITVTPGADGRKQFESDIRRLFDLSSEDDLEYSFDCIDPLNSDVGVVLEGRGAFDAAFHCAAVTAAKRRR